jgi:vacuolar-type H+-ATPase subunit I/STV1
MTNNNTNKKTAEVEELIYEENAPFSNSMKAIITIGFLVLALSYFLFFFKHLVSTNKVPQQMQFALLFATSLYALIMWSFFSIKFKITNNSVEAVMPPFKYSVAFSEIKEIKTISNIPWYVGWGLRIWGKRLAFVSMHKKAVKIEKENRFFRVLVITTRDPDEFVRLVRERMI